MVFKKKIAAFVMAATLSTSMISYLPAYAVDSNALSNDSAVATTPIETENVTATPNDSTPNADTATATPAETPANTENNQQQPDQQQNAPEDQSQPTNSTEEVETEQAPDSSQETAVEGTESASNTESTTNAKTTKEISSDKKRLQKIVNCVFGVVMGIVLFCFGRVLSFVVCSRKR